MVNSSVRLSQWWWQPRGWAAKQSQTRVQRPRQPPVKEECRSRLQPAAAHPGGHAVATATHQMPLKLAQLALPPGESASGWGCHVRAGSVDRREQARGGGFGDVLRPTQTSCPGFWKVRRLGAAGYDIAGESASGWRCHTWAGRGRGQARAREAGWTDVSRRDGAASSGCSVLAPHSNVMWLGAAA